MFRTSTTTNNHQSTTRPSYQRGRTRWFALVVGLSLSVSGLLVLLVRTSPVQSKAAITVQAIGRGKPYFNFRDGQEMRVNYRGEETVTAAMHAGHAQPRSMAAIDLDRDGTPDVVAGYAFNGVGLVTIQHGNPEAFAPKDDSVFARMQQGYNPESLLPTADVYQIPEAVDFLQVGDFNHDNQRDVLVGASGGGLYLLAGNGRGGLGAPEQIALPGPITAMTAGEFRAPDGWTDVAVGVAGSSGPELVIYDGEKGIGIEPMHLALAAPATAVEFGEVDPSPFMGVVVATGSQVEVVHGWGRKQTPTLQSRVETITSGINARGLALGSFVWSRAGSRQIAALGEDGTINILARGELNTHPFSDAENLARARSRASQTRNQVDVEALAGWQAGAGEQWATARQIVTGDVVGANVTAQNLLQRTHISFMGTDDLLVLSANQQKLDIVRQVDATAGALTNALKATGDMVTASLNTTAAPVTTLALPQKLNGERSLLVMQAGSVAPIVVPLAPTAIITVDRTDDPAVTTSGSGAAACTAAANDCSLRGAVLFANANSGTTISLGANTYTLNTNGTGGCVTGEALATGNQIGDLESNTTTTFTGAGQASTIINQIGTGNGAHAGDRVLCMDVNLTPGFTYNISALTMVGGRDVNSNVGGGAIIGGARTTSLTLTNVTFVNNQSTGPNVSGGGAVAVTGGDMTITNCTFGAANAPGASRTDLTLANAVNSNSGGGLSYSPGDPLGAGGATGTLTMTGTSFSHNTSSGVGGGGADLFNFNTSTGTANISTTTFTSNQANGTGSGGALQNESLTNVNISTTSFTNNSALNRGGALYVGGGAVLLDGTNPSVTFSGNTAVNNPTSSSASTASAVNVAGTNTTIGGSIEITLGGVWTNNTGSTLNPTDIDIVGGTLTCNNSTMNVGGNLTLGPSGNGLVGGTFNGNTGTVNLSGNLTTNTGGSGPSPSFNGNSGNFNFVGSSAASSGGTLSPTFNNLTVNKTNTVTLGINSAVTGNLTVTAGTFDLGAFTVNRSAAGGTLTVSNGATLKVGGANPLPTNYSAHSVGATSTIEYSGTTQTVSTLNSAQNYGNLIISGSGTKTLAGATTVATNLTINGGTLDVSASNFALNVAGNFTNNVAAVNFTPRAGTVTFNGGVQNLNGTAPGQTFNNVTVNDTSLTVGGSTTALTLNGGLTITAGTFTAGTAAAINVAGNWTNNAGPGAFVPGAGTVTFNSTTAGQTINGTAVSQTFNGLTVTKAGQVLSTGGSTTQLDLNGPFNLTAGTFTAPATLNVAGDWTEATGTTFTPGAGTVTFNGAGARNLNGTAVTQTFNNLVINKSGGGSVTGGGSTTALTINGGVTLTAGTLAAGTVTAIGLPGDWTNNGGTFTPGTSTVTFNSTTGTQNINGTAASQTFNSITVNKTGQSLQVSGSTLALTLNGSMNIAVGNFNANTAQNVNVGADWTLASGATFTNGGGTNTVTFNGALSQNLNGTAATQTFNNFTVNKTGTLTVGGSTTTLNINKDLTLTTGTLAAGTATAMTVSGNWTNNGGAFTPGAGTVNFNGGAGQAIGGTAATTFNNLTNSNVSGLAMNNDNTVGGTLGLGSTDITVANTRTLSQTSATASTGTGDVIGSVKRSGALPLNTALTFGNPDTRITITSGVAPTDITVKLTETVPTPASTGFANSGYPNAVTRTYVITPTGGSPTATLRLHYNAGEVNGNDPTTMNLWRFDSGINKWRPNVATGRGCSAGCPTVTSNLWAEVSGITTFSPWALNSTNATTAANGAVSGRIVDANGTPVEGAVINLSGDQTRKTITDAQGNYHFDNVETSGFYTVTPSRANYNFNPGNRSFSQVGNQTEALFTGTSTGDNANPLDTPEYFVRRQYVDVLSREPDEGGFNYWSDQILACNGDAQCTSARRRDVAAAFFIEQEAQQTGSYIYDAYTSALGRQPVFNEYRTDRQQVVGGATLDAEKAAFALNFVQRAEFTTKYQSNTAAESFVDALIQNAQNSAGPGVDFSGQRDALIAAYNSGGSVNGGRALVVQALADNAAFKQSQYNAAFVLTEYFSYLRRDAEPEGYNFWLNVLNFGDVNNYRGMVCSFITSAEYQKRFSNVVSHNNTECGQ